MGQRPRTGVGGDKQVVVDTHGGADGCRDAGRRSITDGGGSSVRGEREQMRVLCRGCQDLQSVGAPASTCKISDFGGPWIERTHWKVPHEDTDILVYRPIGSYLCFSQRSGGGGNKWSLPALTKLEDIHSNMNAGTLPDGRVYVSLTHHSTDFSQRSPRRLKRSWSSQPFPD